MNSAEGFQSIIEGPSRAFSEQSSMSVLSSITATNTKTRIASVSESDARIRRGHIRKQSTQKSLPHAETFSADLTREGSLTSSIPSELPTVSELWSVYAKYCPSGLMASSQFMKLLRDAKLLYQGFTVDMAEEEFLRAKAAVAGDDITAAQKISFDIFCTFLVPSVARFRNETVIEVIARLAAAKVQAMSYFHPYLAASASDVTDASDHLPMSENPVAEGSDVVEHTTDNVVSTEALQQLHLLFQHHSISDYMTIDQLADILRQKSIIDDLTHEFILNIFGILNTSESDSKSEIESYGFGFDYLHTKVIPAIASRLGTTSEEVILALCLDDRINYVPQLEVGDSAVMSHDSVGSTEVTPYELSEAERVHLKAVFEHFCPSGGMSSAEFVKVLKSLGNFKTYFTRRDAELIYIRARSSVGGHLGEKVKFNVFSSRMLADVAKARGESVTDLVAHFMTKFPMVEAVSDDNGDLSSPRVVMTSQKIRSPVNLALQPTTAFTSQGPVSSCNQHFSPPRSSSPQYANELPARDAPENIAAPIPSPKGNDSYFADSRGASQQQAVVYSADDISDRLRAIILEFAPSGEVFPFQFLRMMRDLKLFSSAYSRRDAEAIYSRAKAEAFTIEGSDRPRMTPEVFCTLVIPAMAEKRGEGTDTLVTIILSSFESMMRSNYLAPDRVVYRDNCNGEDSGEGRTAISAAGNSVDNVSELILPDSLNDSQMNDDIDSTGDALLSPRRRTDTRLSAQRPKSGPSHVGFRRHRSIRDPVPEHVYDPPPVEPTTLKRPLSGPSNLAGGSGYSGSAKLSRQVRPISRMGQGPRRIVDLNHDADDVDIPEDDSGDSPYDEPREPEPVHDLFPSKQFQQSPRRFVKNSMDGKLISGRHNSPESFPLHEVARPGPTNSEQLTAGPVPSARAPLEQLQEQQPSRNFNTDKRQYGAGAYPNVAIASNPAVPQDKVSAARWTKPPVAVPHNLPALRQPETILRSPRRQSPRRDGHRNEPELTDAEKTLRRLFLRLCPSNEMNFGQFIRLLRCCRLIDYDFTEADAEVLYNMAKAKAAGGGRVPVTQKVGFPLFYTMIIPTIARRRGQSVDDLLVFMEGANRGVRDISGVHPVRRVEYLQSGVEEWREHESNELLPPASNSRSPRLAPHRHRNSAANESSQFQDLVPILREYSVDGDVPSDRFIIFLDDFNLISTKFRKCDAEVIYKRARITSNLSNDFGIFCDKGTFESFCSVFFKEMAAKRLDSVTRTLEHILATARQREEEQHGQHSQPASRKTSGGARANAPVSVQAARARPRADQALPAAQSPRYVSPLPRQPRAADKDASPRRFPISNAKWNHEIIIEY